MKLTDLRKKLNDELVERREKALAQSQSPSPSLIPTRKPVDDPYWNSRLAPRDERPYPVHESAFTQSLRHHYGGQLPRIPSSAVQANPQPSPQVLSQPFNPLGKGCPDCLGEEPWIGSCKFCNEDARKLEVVHRSGERLGCGHIFIVNEAGIARKHFVPFNQLSARTTIHLGEQEIEI